MSEQQHQSLTYDTDLHDVSICSSPFTLETIVNAWRWPADWTQAEVNKFNEMWEVRAFTNAEGLTQSFHYLGPDPYCLWMVKNPDHAGGIPYYEALLRSFKAAGILGFKLDEDDVVSAEELPGGIGPRQLVWPMNESNEATPLKDENSGSESNEAIQAEDVSSGTESNEASQSKDVSSGPTREHIDT